MSTAAEATTAARLRELVADYLRVRRALGHALVDPERKLFAFVDYLETVGARAVTVEHAVGFATAGPDVSPRTQALRLSAVRLFARWAHLLDPTVQVPPARLLPARSTRAAPYLYSETEWPVGRATVYAVHRTVRLLLSVLVRRPEYGLTRNVAKDVEMAAPRRPPILTWDAEQLGRFLDAAEREDDPLLVAWYVVICLGLRRGELCGLRWAWIDLDRGTVTIPDEPRTTIVVVDGEAEDSRPKTAGSSATLSMDAGTVEMLRWHRRRQAEQQLAAGSAWRNDRGLVLTRADGSAWHPDAVSRRFRRIAELAELPPIPPKNLRHSSATLGSTPAPRRWAR
jgi:integrase